MCTYKYTNAHIQVCTHAQAHACEHCVHTQAHARTQTWMHIHARTRTYTSLNACSHTCTHKHTCKHTHMHTRMHAQAHTKHGRTHMYKHMHRFTCVHTQARIHAHTSMHTRTHKHTPHGGTLCHFLQVYCSPRTKAGCWLRCWGKQPRGWSGAWRVASPVFPRPWRIASSRPQKSKDKGGPGDSVPASQSGETSGAKPHSFPTLNPLTPRHNQDISFHARPVFP